MTGPPRAAHRRRPAGRVRNGRQAPRRVPAGRGAVAFPHPLGGRGSLHAPAPCLTLRLPVLMPQSERVSLRGARALGRAPRQKPTTNKKGPKSGGAPRRFAARATRRRSGRGRRCRMRRAAPPPRSGRPPGRPGRGRPRRALLRRGEPPVPSAAVKGKKPEFPAMRARGAGPRPAPALPKLQHFRPRAPAGAGPHPAGGARPAGHRAWGGLAH